VVARIRPPRAGGRHGREEGDGGSDPATPRLIDAMADDEVGRAAEEEERGKGKRAAWRKRQGACRGRRGSAGRTSEEEERGGRAHGVERERRERAAER